MLVVLVLVPVLVLEMECGDYPSRCKIPSIKSLYRGQRVHVRVQTKAKKEGTESVVETKARMEINSDGVKKRGLNIRADDEDAGRCRIEVMEIE